MQMKPKVNWKYIPWVKNFHTCKMLRPMERKNSHWPNVKMTTMNLWKATESQHKHSSLKHSKPIHHTQKILYFWPVSICSTACYCFSYNIQKYITTTWCCNKSYTDTIITFNCETCFLEHTASYTNLHKWAIETEGTTSAAMPWNNRTE